jgi:raffinose/stachyose/melibiose transport system substrate-binding protein
MEMVTQFMIDNPHIIVEPDIQPSADHRTKLLVEFTAGNPPEVSQVPINFLHEFARSDLIYYWEPILDANPHIRDRFAPNILQNMAINGRISSVPIEASIDGLMVNNALLRQHGWSAPQTFDDMIDLAAKCRAAGIHLMVTGGADIRFAWLASAFMSRTAGWDTSVALAMGDAFDQWNNPAYGFVSAMEHWARLVAAEAFPPDVLAFSGLDADQFFAREEALMYYEGAWKPANFVTAGGMEFVDKLRRFEFPAFPDAVPGGDPSVRVGGNVWGLTIPAGLNETQMDAVIRFADAYTHPDHMRRYLETGARIPAGIADWDRSLTLPLFNEFVDAYRNSTRLLLSMDGLTVPAVDFAIKQTAMPGIIAGELSVAEAVAFVQMTAEEHLRAIG